MQPSAGRLVLISLRCSSRPSTVIYPSIFEKEFPFRETTVGIGSICNGDPSCPQLRGITAYFHRVKLGTIPGYECMCMKITFILTTLMRHDGTRKANKLIGFKFIIILYVHSLRFWIASI